jgi:hypothetical protein
VVGALSALASFFGGRGFSLRKNCASAGLAEVNKTNATTIALSGVNGFMIFWEPGSGEVGHTNHINTTKCMGENVPLNSESVGDDKFGKNCDSQSSKFVATPNRVQKKQGDQRLIRSVVAAGVVKKTRTES